MPRTRLLLIVACLAVLVGVAYVLTRQAASPTTEETTSTTTTTTGQELPPGATLDTAAGPDTSSYGTSSTMPSDTSATAPVPPTDISATETSTTTTTDQD